jgi:hypothetical protein
MADRQRSRIRTSWKYEELSSVDEGGLRRYKKDGLWGLCRPYGEPVTEPIFTRIKHYDPQRDAWIGVKGNHIEIINNNFDLPTDVERTQKQPHPEWAL